MSRQTTIRCDRCKTILEFNPRSVFINGDPLDLCAGCIGKEVAELYAGLPKDVSITITTKGGLVAVKR